MKTDVHDTISKTYVVLKKALLSKLVLRHRYKILRYMLRACIQKLCPRKSPTQKADLARHGQVAKIFRRTFSRTQLLYTWSKHRSAFHVKNWSKKGKR